MLGRAGAAVVGLCCLLSGCSGSDPPPSTPTATTASSTSATATTTPAPSSSVAPTGAPVLPEAARQQTPEGAEAFVRHWFALLNFGYASMNPAPYLQISAASCRTCAALAQTITEVNERGNRIGGGVITVKQTDASQVLSNGSSTVTALFGAAELREEASDGTLVKVIEADGGDVSYLINLEWTQNSWFVSAARLLAS